MIKWIKNKFTKEKYKLVKTITRKVNVHTPKSSGTFYFHLFESNRGNRKVELGTDLQGVVGPLQGLANQIPEYHNIVYPWVNGINDNDIPTYETASDTIVEKELDIDEMVEKLLGRYF